MKQITALISAAIAVSLLPVFSIAGENISYKADSPYFSVKDADVTVTITDTGEKASPEAAPLPPLRRDDTKIVAAAAIINTGVQAWNIINSAQPNGNVNTGYANAMPNFVDWNTIAGWKGPKEVIYGVQIKNLYGMTVVNVKYMVSFFYGGTSGANDNVAGCLIAAGCKTGAATCPEIAAKCAAAAKGKGSYISNMKVKPLVVDILWGFKYDLDCQVSNPMNIGTLDDPVAYLQADLTASFSTLFKKSRDVYTYSVDGTGNFKDITRIIQDKTAEKGVIKTDFNTQIDWN